MSSLKNRVLKIEQSREALEPMPHVNSEETRQWLNDLIQRINDGTYVAEPKKPREPLPPDASYTKRWLYETLERLESENEQLK